MQSRYGEQKCDMIKGNDSDVANFELQTKRGDKLLFYIVRNIKELSISQEPDVWAQWSLNQNVAFQMDKKFYNENSELNIVDVWLIPLI